MEQLRRGDKVNFIGGNLVIGQHPSGEPVEKHFNRANNTFIWSAFEYGGESMYAIQHKDGLDKVVFVQMAMQIDSFNINDLKEGNKYILVDGAQLELVEAVARPKPKPSQTTEPAQSQDVPQDDVPQDDVPQDDVPQGNQEDVSPSTQDHTTIEEIQENHTAHYEVGQFPLDLMVDVVKKAIVAKAMKVPHPFTVKGGDDNIQKGNGGDFLLYSGGNNLYACDKSVFHLNYEIVAEIRKINIQGTDFNVPREIFEYVQWLQNENERLRSELYLKIHPSDSSEGAPNEVPSTPTERQHKVEGVSSQGEPIVGQTTIDVGGEATPPQGKTQTEIGD